MKRTTIVLPPELKERAVKRARNMGVSLSQLIREALDKALRLQKSTKVDSFFADKAVFRGKAPRDLAKNHDSYLYGPIVK